MESGELPLRDIHLPEAVGWWPPALGWWLLSILLVISFGLAFWIFKRISQWTATKVAKKLLLQIKQDRQRDSSEKLRDLSALLRRVAISKTGRKECAGLTGRQWLEFLDRSVKGTPFTGGVGQLLADAPYQKNPPTESEITQLTKLCEDWLNAQTKGKR